MRSRLLGAPITLLGGGGFIAALVSAYIGMRHVMRTSGGFCASGGPYVIAHQCSGSDVKLILFGVFGMLLAGLTLMVGLGLLRGPLLAAGLLMWTGLFGALGWNFLSLGFNPPAHQSGTAGWIVCGVIFELMAVGGLIPAVMVVISGLRGRAASGAGPQIHPISARGPRAQARPMGEPSPTLRTAGDHW